MASLMTLAGSYGSLASNIPATATDSSINVDESEDVIILGKTLQETDTPLNPDYESRHSRSSLEEPARPYKERWAHKVEFILSSLSMFLGLGSIWRFPFTVYENGGGAFLVPYFIFLFGIAKPLSVVDLSLGQFSGKGPYGIWDVVPILRGVGILTVFIAAMTLTYVCAILSFCVAYLYRGIQGKLPWVECNTDLYVKRKFIENLTCSPDPGEHYPTLDANSTLYYKSNAELYFQYNVVKLVENIDDGIGLPDIELVCCLFFVWLLLFLSFTNGARSTGKVAICTAILPPIVLIAVFARALCLEGAFVGVIYFFKPDWEAILTFRVWRNALSQAFFSMAVGYGNIIYGSYNSFRATIKRDAIYIALMDVIYCLGAGVTVFSILGELSRRKGLKIEQIAQGDLGLAFVTYPEVLTYFGPTPYPQIFSFIFFTMLLSLGIGHSAAYFHPILATVYAIFPSTAKTHSRRVVLTGFLCFLGFLCGLAYTAPGGLFIVHLIDHFLTGIIVYSAVVFELIGIFWIYGVSNYIQDIEFMLNTKVSRIYKIWCYCIPLFMLCVAVYTLIELEEPVVNVNHSPVEFPNNVLMLAYLFTIILLAIIPVGAVIVFCTRKTRSCSKKYLASVYPNTRWGPADPEIRGQWEIFKKSFHNKKNEGKPYQIMIGQLSRRKYRQKGEAGTSMENIGDSLSGSGGIPVVVYDKPSVVCNFQISSVNLSGHQQLDSNLEQFNEL